MGIEVNHGMRGTIIPMENPTDNIENELGNTCLQSMLVETVFKPWVMNHNFDHDY